MDDTTKKLRIALIDLSGIARAAWHRSENEEISSAFNRTVSQVAGYAAGFDAVAICVDRPPYLRKALLPSYKEHREKAPAAMHEQFRKIEAQLDADGFHIVGAQGYEADDIIGKIAQWGEDQGHDVVIYSSDKDLMQHIGDRVTVVSPMTGDRYDSAAIVARYGIGPELIPDMLALMGDKSDGIPGIEGVGPKTAAKLLVKAGSLTAMLAKPELIEERFRQMVVDAREQVALSFKLAQPMLDAPINPSDILAKKQRKSATPQAEINFDDEEETEDPAPRSPPPRAADTRGAFETDEEKAAEAKPQPPERQMPAPEIVAPPQPKTAHLAVVPKQSDTTALAPVSWEKALEPRNLSQAWNLAISLYEARIFGDWPNPQAVLSVIMTGRSMGLDAVTSLRSFHYIEGKAAPHAHLLIGKVKQSPLCKYFRLVETTNERATYETWREGEPEPTVLTYTIEQAKDAELTRPSRSGKPSNWVKRPDEMLRKTCGAQLARAVYPDLTMGLHSAEELENAA